MPKLPRPSRAKPVAAEKRHGRRPAAAPAVTEPAPASPQAMPPDCLPITPIAQDESAAVANGIAEAKAAVEATEPVITPPFAAKPLTLDAAPAETARRNLIQKVRDWLRRAA